MEEKNLKLEGYLGQVQKLAVVKQVDFGVYLGSEAEKVLLPKKQVPEPVEKGQELEVFLYRDSMDRLIATTQLPKITLGKLALLTVKEVGKIGAFLDWGLEKDLLLPFREQTGKAREGQEVLVSLYVDKTKRLCATMKIYEHLRTDSPYEKDAQVEGRVYEISDNFGVFVAVDDQYSGRIPKQEALGTFAVGDRIQARVSRVKEDGKLDLSIRKKAFLQMEDDAKLLLEKLKERGGSLPFTDKADPDRIRRETGLSKNGFKRAVGRLMKEKQVKILEHSIVLEKES